MNTFYFNDKTERIEAQKPNLSSVYYTEIKTVKDFDMLVEDYEAARKEGNSIIDSIEWAK